MTTTKRNASTHSGHCQACGRLQKLPGGVLAKHGYTVAGGYFSGVCVGANHQPFELSFDMLPGFIRGAEAALKSLRERQVKLDVEPVEPAAIVESYEANAAHGAGKPGNGHVWRKVTIIERDGKRGYMAPGKARHAWDREFERSTFHAFEYYQWHTSETLTAHALKLNREYSARVLQPQVVDLVKYISWQEARIAKWAPAPLLAHDAKADKADRAAAFVPADYAVEAAD